ncbi:MAG: hypothetical protein BWY75_01290 [bacterium ADurb.Bin425]|nr:MAG: hypothetical protein BWY75_01290 [bacterium ADurb.Bin425]
MTRFFAEGHQARSLHTADANVDFGAFVELVGDLVVTTAGDVQCGHIVYVLRMVKTGRSKCLTHGQVDSARSKFVGMTT